MGIKIYIALDNRKEICLNCSYYNEGPYASCRNKLVPVKLNGIPPIAYCTQWKD